MTKPDPERLTADVLVIGCGIAGASFALEAAKRGLKIVILSRNADPRESNSFYAQGGIVTLGPNDDPASLREDIIRTGDGISDPEAVAVLVNECRPLVQEILIDELDVPFSRNAGGELDYAQEAGHSRRRILHVADATGRTIEERFLAKLGSFPNVSLLPGHTAVDLLTVPHHSKNAIDYYHPPRCLGAYVLDNASGAVKSIFAAQTVLAAGGCGSVYLHTSNPPDAIGAGYAMALRAGARIVNMEYI